VNERSANDLLTKIELSRNMYLNGNYIVTSSYNNFTIKKRALRINEELKADFPDSIDLKISNRCSIGCKYCHENSIPTGDIFDFDKTTKILSQLPEVPIEIAIGGGDVFESPVETLKLIDWLNKRKNKPRITINFADFYRSWKNQRAIQAIINGVEALGVSIENLDNKVIEYGHIRRASDVGDSYVCIGRRQVYHIILGIFPPEQIFTLYEKGVANILILGYKQWGRAKNNPLPLEKIKETRGVFKEILADNYKKGHDTVFGFDNLALEQLDLRSLLPEEVLEQVYLGDEGSCSMYIDAVKGEFARTSRDPKRVSWDSIGLIDFFKQL
jgi:hypothetical protein